MSHRPRVWGRITGWSAEMQRSNERRQQREQNAPPPPAGDLEEFEAQLQQLALGPPPVWRAPRQPRARGNVDEEDGEPLDVAPDFPLPRRPPLRPLEHSPPPSSSSARDPPAASVQADVSRMLENELFADVVFVVGAQKERIFAHKFVLSVRSRVFAAMFHSAGFPQAADGGRQEVVVPDIEPATFRLVLRFVYADQLHVTADEVMGVVYAARKYEIQSMEAACTAWLKRHLDAENVFLVLEQARLFDLHELAAVAWEFVDAQPAAVLAGDSFAGVQYALLCELLARDSFGVREREIFEAAVRWALAEAKRQQLPPTNDALRAVLGDALRLVRFPLMSAQEFAAAVVLSPTPLLSEREQLDVFAHIAVAQPAQSSAWPMREQAAVELAAAISRLPPLAFSSAPRHSPPASGRTPGFQRGAHGWRGSL
ncbi:BTB/POZ domain-containing protein 2 [Aphelenchoides fujianensis]|nr:BTB/POZ domain-containing protein 2 [Aphelenchoides fujianensis]